MDYWQEEIVESLSYCTNEQLSEVINEVFAARAENGISAAETKEFLAECTNNELSDVLSQIFAARAESGIDNNSYTEYRFVLCNAFRFLKEDDENRWIFRYLAGRDISKYSAIWRNKGFPQSGTCRNCDVEFNSHVKGGICPLCGGEIYLT